MSYFTFLLENMLWSFLPWIFCFLLGLVFSLIELVKKKFRIEAKEEWISTGGFMVTYCILARSQAQLPHYIFVVFPLAAIVTARFLYRLFYTGELLRWKRPLLILHAVIFSLLWAAVIVLMAWPFEQVPKYVAGIAGFCFVFFLLLMGSRKKSFPMHLELAFFTIIGVNVFLNTAFYPSLLKYQLGNDAAAFIKDQHIPKQDLSIYGIGAGGSFYFYNDYLFNTQKSPHDFQENEIVLTAKDSLPVFQQLFPKLKIMHEGNHFGVSQLTLPFLNPETREKELPKYLIIDLSGNR
jgi:hypothetical protein